MRTPTLSGALAVGAGLLLLAGASTPAAAAKAKPITASNLKKLTSSVAAAKKLTFEATYKSVSGNQTTTVTIAQAPPKTVFTTSGGEVVDTGSATYYCSTSSGKPTCLNASTGTNPFSALQDIFSPALALTAFNEAKEGLVSRALGIKATSSTQTFAGQSATCVSVTVHGRGGKYCVTKQGLLAYSGSSSTSSSYFVLTKFTTSPPSSLFQLPAGATTVTLPGGVTIP